MTSPPSQKTHTQFCVRPFTWIIEHCVEFYSVVLTLWQRGFNFNPLWGCRRWRRRNHNIQNPTHGKHWISRWVQIITLIYTYKILLMPTTTYLHLANSTSRLVCKDPPKNLKTNKKSWKNLIKNGDFRFSILAIRSLTRSLQLSWFQSLIQGTFFLHIKCTLQLIDWLSLGYATLDHAFW